MVALFGNTFPFLLIAFGMLFAPSALGAIVGGTLPIFTAVLAHYFIPSDTITPKKIAGIVFGIIGLLWIFLPAAAGQNKGELMGIALNALANFCYAIGIIYTKKQVKDSIDPQVLVTGQLLLGCILTLPFCLSMDHFWPSNLLHIQVRTLVSVMLLGLLGTTIAFLLFHFILRRTSASFLSYIGLLIPIAGTLIGKLLCHEALHSYTLFGFVWILVGLFTMTYQKQIASSKTPLSN